MGETGQGGGSLSLLYNSIFLTSALRLYHDVTNHSSHRCAISLWTV